MQGPDLIINLASGLIGAIVGAGAALYLGWSDRDHRTAGAARAIHTEMVTNAAYLEALAGQGEVWGPISDALWRSQVAQIAPALSADDFRVLAGAYLGIGACEHIRVEFLADRRPIVPTERDMLAAAAAEFLAGAEVLRRRWWP